MIEEMRLTETEDARKSNDIVVVFDVPTSHLLSKALKKAFLDALPRHELSRHIVKLRGLS